jgi:hypothetical protein
MPQIIVIADTPAEDGAAQVLLRERVTERLFESGHFGKQLVERLGWAVGDAVARDRQRRLHGGPSQAAAAPDAQLAQELPAAQRPSARVVTTAS